MRGVEKALRAGAAGQLSLFTDEVPASAVVLVALVDPSEFMPDAASLSRPDRQRHRWLIERLAMRGFRVIRHTFHAPEIANPWECEETPAGTVIYRQWPEPDWLEPRGLVPALPHDSRSAGTSAAAMGDALPPPGDG